MASQLTNPRRALLAKERDAASPLEPGKKRAIWSIWPNKQNGNIAVIRLVHPHFPLHAALLCSLLASHELPFLLPIAPTGTPLVSCAARITDCKEAREETHYVNVHAGGPGDGTPALLGLKRRHLM